MTRLLELQMCKISVVFLSFALMAGCSTKHARIQDVSITTDPAGIRATIDDKSCIAPCSLKDVDRTAEYIMFERDAYTQQFALEKKYDPSATVKVKIFSEWEMGISAFLITGAAYEILPIDVKFSGSAENPLKTTSPVGDTSGLREVAVDPDLKSEQTSSAEPKERPFALSVGVSRNFYAYDARILTGVLRFEKMLGTNGSWYFDVGYADYRSTDGRYRDTAHGLGGEVGMNIYSRGRALEGLYFGGGIGFWDLKGDWNDDAGTPFETTGTGKARVSDINVHLGYKWAFAGSGGFFIDSSIALDAMSTYCEPYPFGPAGGSLKAGLAIGKRW